MLQYLWVLTPGLWYDLRSFLLTISRQRSDSESFTGSELWKEKERNRRLGQCAMYVCTVITHCCLLGLGQDEHLHELDGHCSDTTRHHTQIKHVIVNKIIEGCMQDF